jgi:hypothetical protein
VVTGAELAAGMGPAISAAKAMGVDYETAMAMIAGATKEGGPAAQNINTMTNLFNKLSTTEAQKHIKALGVKMVDASGDFRSPVDVLGDLKDRLGDMTEAGRAAAMQAIFPDAQARQGAQVVMSQLDMVRETLAANREATGTTENAYKKMSSTFNSQMKLMQNGGMAILTTLGAALLPSITPLIGGLADALEGAMPAIKGFADGASAAIQGVIKGFQTGGVAGGAVSILTLLGVDEGAAEGAVATVTGIVTRIKDTITSVIGGFQTGGAVGGTINILTMMGLDQQSATDAVATIQNIVTQVSGAFDSLKAIFGGGDQAQGELQLATILNEAFGPDVANTIVGTIQTIKGALDGLKAGFDAFVAGFREGGITEAIQSVFGPEAAAAVGSLMTSIQGFAATVADVFVNQVLPALGQFKDFIGPAMVPVLQGFATLIGASVVVGIQALSVALDAVTFVIGNTGKAFEILGGSAPSSPSWARTRTRSRPTSGRRSAISARLPARWPPRSANSSQTSAPGRKRPRTTSSPRSIG